jgi:hypothetical protein
MSPPTSLQVGVDGAAQIRARVVALRAGIEAAEAKRARIAQAVAARRITIERLTAQLALLGEDCMARHPDA